MRALFQAIASAVRSWLNSVRRRPTAPQHEGKLCGTHDGETSQEKDRAGPNSDSAQASDATPATARISEPKAPAANDVVARACVEVADSASTPPQTEPETPPARAATSQEPSNANEGMAGDEVHPSSLDSEPEPPLPHQEAISSDVRAAGDALPAAPGGPGESIGGLPSPQLGKAPESDPSSPSGTTESIQDTSPARDAGDDIGDGRERTAGRSSKDGPGDPTSDPADGEHPHLTEFAKPLIAPHESIDRGDEALHEPAARVPEGEAVSQPSEVPTTSEPNNFVGEVRHEANVFPGETAVVSDTDDVDSILTENAGTDGEAGLEAERTPDEVKPEGDRILAVPSTSTPESEGRHPPQYRAPTGPPPPGKKRSQSRTHGRKRQRTTNPGPAAIEVRVRILFQHGGYCIVSLLPKRLPGLPEELIASSQAGDVELQALQEEWYQDVAPDNLANLLRMGFVWRDPDTGQEWMLSGREVFVLAHGTTHRGFLSCPRLALGRDHVVLCTVGRLSAVGDALRAAGCADWTQLGEDDGAPPGWLVLRKIRPQRPVPLSSEADILNVLRPVPEIEIALEGGIRLAYNSWLLGYPPAIRIYGAPERAVAVLIDGKKATGSEQDGYTVPDWDVEGDHQVSCSITTKSYSLVHCKTIWTYWPAYSFSLRNSGGEDREFQFCGPLVRPVAINAQLAQLAQRQVTQVPPTNPVLLGACPGEVFFAHRRMEVRGAQCLGLPPFDPLWALPAQPLQCDKRTNRILLVGEPIAESNGASRQPLKNHPDLERWCRLVLDASRKGLAVEPASPATHRLWRDYKLRARSLWRRLR